METIIRKINGSYCNCYQVTTNMGTTLIDYGRHDLVQQAIDKIQISRVLLTHCHRENSCDLALFPCEVVAYGVEYEILSDIPYYWNKLWGLKYANLGTPYVRPPIQMPAGNVINGNEIDISPFIPVPTPGHSPGHTSYLLDAGGIRYAFTGGLMYKGGKIPNLFDCEWDYGYMQGLFTTVNSMRLLAQYKPDVLLPDRGEPINNGTYGLMETADNIERLANFLLRDYDSLCNPPQDSGLLKKDTVVSGVDELSPHLLRVKAGYSNMYIVLGENNHAFLVDCGATAISSGRGEPGLIDNIKALMTQYKIASLRCVLLTHYHGDHYISFDSLHRVFGTELWVYENMVAVVEHPLRYRYPALLPWYDQPVSRLLASLNDSTLDTVRSSNTKMFRTMVNRIISDGEILDLCGYQIKVFHLPGQTNLSCGFSTNIDGKHVVFSGDNFYYTPEDGKSGHDCFVVSNCALPETEGYLKCAQVLLLEKPDLVLCGHAFVIENPMPQIQALESFAFKLVQQLQQHLPEPQYEWYADPYWASPVGSLHSVNRGDWLQVHVNLRNHSKFFTRFTGKICLTKEMFCYDPYFDIVLPGKGETRIAFDIRILNESHVGNYPIAVDIKRNDYDAGQLFDNIIRVD